MRPILALALLLPVLAGCTSCTPELVSAVLTLELADEETRTLPMIASGATEIAGVAVPIPDSHGWIILRPSLGHGLGTAEVTSLRMTLAADGSALPVRIVHVEGMGWRTDDRGDTWRGEVADNATFKVWWAVDRSRVADVADLALREGAPYQASFEAAWVHRSCAFRASGTATKDVQDFVQASVNARALEPAGQASVETVGAGVGFRAPYRVRSGLEMDVHNAEALAVFLSTDPARLAVVTWPEVGWTVNGLPGDHVAPTQTLTVHSSATALTRATYAPSGTATPPGSATGRGLWVLVVSVAYSATDPTLGATRDTFAHGVPA